MAWMMPLRATVPSISCGTSGRHLSFVQICPSAPTRPTIRAMMPLPGCLRAVCLERCSRSHRSPEELSRARLRGRQFPRGHFASDGNPLGYGQELGSGAVCKACVSVWSPDVTPQDHPEIIDSLAAEYVLGHISGPARRPLREVAGNYTARAGALPLLGKRISCSLQRASGQSGPSRVWQGIAPPQLHSREPRRRPARALAIAASCVASSPGCRQCCTGAPRPGKLVEVATIQHADRLAGVAGRCLQWPFDRARRPAPTASDRSRFRAMALPAGGKPGFARRVADGRYGAPHPDSGAAGGSGQCGRRSR